MNTVIETKFNGNKRDGNGADEPVYPVTIASEPDPVKTTTPAPTSIQWSWACRKLASLPCMALADAASSPPLPGDVALMRVEKPGFHKYLTTAENRRLRLY